MKGAYCNSDGGDCNAYQSHEAEAEADDDDYPPKPIAIDSPQLRSSEEGKEVSVPHVNARG